MITTCSRLVTTTGNKECEHALPGIGLTTTIIVTTCLQIRYACVPIQQWIVIVAIYHIAALFKWLGIV